MCRNSDSVRWQKTPRHARFCGTSRWTRTESQRRQCSQDMLNNDFHVHLSNAYLTKGDVPTMAASLDLRARCNGQS